MKAIENRHLTGERALFFERGSEITGCLFDDGESPLKHSSDIKIKDCTFGWKYPLWYSKNIEVENTRLLNTARSGIWYTENITMTDCTVDAPKTFRRAKGITLTRVDLNNAEETLWSCSEVRLTDVHAVGDYFGMNCEDVVLERVRIDGNYCFDGAKRVRVTDSVLNSKDAFWNCEDVRVEHSTIIGEYLAWNTRRLTLVDCTVESDQGLCYVDELIMENCRTERTELAFEYSTVNARLLSSVDSVKNPLSGRIEAESIGRIIHEPERVDVSATEIIPRDGVYNAVKE
jgi:hypothetical protein